MRTIDKLIYYDVIKSSRQSALDISNDEKALGVVGELWKPSLIIVDSFIYKEITQYTERIENHTSNCWRTKPRG